MDNIARLNLFLGNEECASTLKKNIYEEELRELNLKHPLEKGNFDIAQTYVISKDEANIEVGFYIRNALEEEILIENIPLAVEDCGGKIIATKAFNFKDYGPIPPNTARPFIIILPLKKDEVFNNSEKYYIKLYEPKEVNAFYSVNTRIEDLPIDITFEDENEFRTFEKALKTLKTDEFAVDIFRLEWKDNNVLICKILFRNGRNNEVIIRKIPITIINDNNEVIAKTIFENNEGLFSVPSTKSKLMNMELRLLQGDKSSIELCKCKVLFQ